METLTFTYEKSNVYEGVTYLHGWEGKPYLSRWINGSLRRYDALFLLPTPGDILTCEAEFVSQSGPFVTYYLYSIQIA